MQNTIFSWTHCTNQHCDYEPSTKFLFPHACDVLNCTICHVFLETRPGSSCIQLYPVVTNQHSKKGCVKVEFTLCSHKKNMSCAPAGTLTPSLGPSAMAWHKSTSNTLESDSCDLKSSLWGLSWSQCLSWFVYQQLEVLNVKISSIQTGHV